MQTLGICLIVGAVLIGTIFICLFYRYHNKGMPPNRGTVDEDSVTDRNNTIIVNLQCPKCGYKFKVGYIGQNAEICDKCGEAFPVTGNICPGG